MSRAYDVVDIGNLPPPTLTEEVDYEALFDRRLEKYVELYPEFEDESKFEPVRAHIGVAANSEMLVRQRINQAARASQLATAEDADLDVWGWSRRTPRLVLDAGDPTAIPPVDPIMEEDEDYRLRIQLAPESWSVAGPGGAYEYWARAVAGVRDVLALSPSPAVVSIYVAPVDLSAPATPDLLTAVDAECSEETRRPIGDRVTVFASPIIAFERTAVLKILNGPGAAEVQAAALLSWEKMLTDRAHIGTDIPVSVQYAALSVPGVQWVDLEGAASVPVAATEIARCTALTLSVEVVDG